MKKFSLIIYIIIIISCKSTMVPLTLSNSLLGVVFDNKNNPIQNVEIIFTNDKGHEIVILLTDIDGKFFIPELKMGNYTVTLSSESILTKEIKVKHFDIENVLILKVHTYKDKISSLENSLKTKNYITSKSILEELETVYKDNNYYNYLKAIYSINTKSYLNAEHLLLDLLDTQSSYVILLLADLYQFYLKENKKALYYLNIFIENENNQKIQDRIEELSNDI